VLIKSTTPGDIYIYDDRVHNYRQHCALYINMPRSDVTTTDITLHSNVYTRIDTHDGEN